MARAESSGRRALQTAAFTFSLYLANVLLGKLIIVTDSDYLERFHAGDVIEMLLLLAAVVAFVIAALKREAAAMPDDGEASRGKLEKGGGHDDGIR